MGALRPRQQALRDGRVALVRSAAPGDAEAVVRHLNQAGGESDFLSFGEDEYYRSVDAQKTMLAEHLGQANHLYAIALVDGFIAGHVSFSSGTRPRTRFGGELGIAVRKAFWGQGLGRILMETLLDWARPNAHVRKINLRTRSDNEAAISLYLQLGFEREGLIRQDNFIEGAFFDTLWMGLIV
jgi:RimJ/RimL family protein N-acetyltransferase